MKLMDPDRDLPPMTTVIQAYRFALDPTPRQRRALASRCGAARFAYNWSLALVKMRLDERQTDPQVQVPWSLPDLRWEWNRAKQQVAPWWTENSKEAYDSGLDGLARALKNWSDGKSGRRKGPPMGFPKWKKKERARDACRFTTGQIKVLPDRKHIQLPRLGVLKTHASTRKLARRLEHNTARVLAATVTGTADRWFVSFDVEVQRHFPTGNGKTAVVGVDVGIRYLAVLSTGASPVPNPHALESSLRRLRRAGRELARRRPGSRRRDRTRRRLARVHAHTSNIRRHALHQLTTALATENGIVSIVQDVLGLRMGEGQAHPQRAQLQLRSMWSPGRSRPERCSEPREPDEERRPEWLGDTKRSWSGRKTRPGRAGRDEARSRHWARLG
jgi:putative transposase